MTNESNEKIYFSWIINLIFEQTMARTLANTSPQTKT